MTSKHTGMPNRKKMTRADKERAALSAAAATREEVSRIKYEIMCLALAMVIAASFFGAILGGLDAARARDAEHVIPVYSKSGGIFGYITRSEDRARVVCLILALGVAVLSFIVMRIYAPRRRRGSERSAMPHDSPQRIRHRAYAYVTNGRRLLVFRHVHFPEAGLQVPAGTIEPGEDPAEAVLREAEEETGLKGLELVSFLAHDERDMSDCGANELQHRWFFHLRYDGEPKESWRHAETSGGKHEPVWFEFFWAELPDRVPKLVANYDDYVSRLPAAPAGVHPQFGGGPGPS